jgi:hypothetical protein
MVPAQKIYSSVVMKLIYTNFGVFHDVSVPHEVLVVLLIVSKTNEIPHIGFAFPAIIGTLAKSCFVNKTV